MILRPRQEEFVTACLAALGEHKNTLGVAPTGAGKSVMMAAMCNKLEGKKLVLQHRDELVKQNKATLSRLNPLARSGIYNADEKNWRRDVTYAMIQTLSRGANLGTMPAVDAVVIDEAHHAAASSYQRVLDRARQLNNNVSILGVTATPERADGKGLRTTFDNIGDIITIGELIQAGHLVRPRTFVVDLGVNDELRKVRRTAQDFDMQEVERILDHKVLNEHVVTKWKEIAGSRKTIGFASTIKHAVHMCEAFQAAGVAAGVVTGDMSDSERANALKQHERGIIQVLINVAVLTEGYDSPTVDCVLLLRPSSHKSTMIQMIGRGLRTVDPERHLGAVKTDCIVIDFGTSVLTHGSLEQDIKLKGREKEAGIAPKKFCPECRASIPVATRECPLCGYEYPPPEEVSKAALENVVMTEIDIMNESPFKWETLFNGLVMVATAFDAWAVCVNFKGVWHAVGGCQETGVKHVGAGASVTAIAAADDYLRMYGDNKAAGKSKRWLTLPATPKQLEALGVRPEHGYGINRYLAACRITWKWHEKAIKMKVAA